MHFLAYHFPVNNPCSVHIETSQLTCFANQSTGFKNEWNTVRNAPFGTYAKLSKKLTFVYEKNS